MIKLSQKGAQIIDIVPAGRLHEDCKQIISAEDFSLRERRKMAYAGYLGITVVVNNKGTLIGGPDPRASGFPHGPNGDTLESFLDEVAAQAERAFFTISKERRKDEDEIENVIRKRLRKWLRNNTGKRAIVEVTAIKV